MRSASAASEPAKPGMAAGLVQTAADFFKGDRAQLSDTSGASVQADDTLSKSDLATRPIEAGRQAAPLVPLQLGSVLSHPNDPARRYGIATARQLEHSIYYDALDLNCRACGAMLSQIPPYGICSQCQSPLDVELIHERLLPADGPHPDKEIQRLLKLSATHTGILPHRDVLQYREHVYTVVEHPGRWGVLVRGRRQRAPDEALAGVVQIGNTLAYLHGHGFTLSGVDGKGGIESLVAVGGGKDIKLADLSACVPLPTGDSGAVRALTAYAITFLGRLLFYLATNRDLSRVDIGVAPPALRPFIEKSTQGQYAGVDDMLADLALLPSTSPPSRSLKASHGQATHPGQKHARNEDAVVTFTYDKEQDGRAVPIGFYLVADGMGGHDAGDLASRTVNQVVTDRIIKIKVLPDLGKSTRRLTTEDVTADILSEAILKANETILTHGQKAGSDLGSTVTAVLIMGDVATIASVGDSRTYLLREDRFEQVTRDHSLVARLVDAGVIKPEDVRSHPQRNQIYRCLGHKPTIDVDTFTVQLQRGDRLVLCSDGLWEMVQDGDIQALVEDARSPQKACDALIDAANRAGGEDNIAVVVVELE
jgi:serine/threonine protein phosphatase PrpC